MMSRAHHLPLVASRQDVLEASTGCLTKDVLERSLEENVSLKGWSGAGITSLRCCFVLASSSRRSWHLAIWRLSSAGLSPR